MNQLPKNDRSSLGQSSDGFRPPLGGDEEHVKIRFNLDQGEDGYPPAKVENLWALSLGRGQYKINNIPFFILGVSCDDIVNAQEDRNGILHYVDLVSEGGHSTVRVILFDNPQDDIPLNERRMQLREKLRHLGCATEQSHIPGLFSVDIPPTVNFIEIRTLLEQGAADGQWDYEEATVAHS